MNFARLLFVFALTATLLAPVGRAANSIWTGATDSNWSTSTNWTPAAPASSQDTAIFNASSGSTNTTLTGGGMGLIEFSSDALANTVTVSGNFTLYGGTTNFSSNAQTFIIGSSGTINFTNTSSANWVTFLNNHNLNFFSASTLSSSTLTNNGTTAFSNSASAGSATITNNNGGILSFSASATAGSAAITNDGTVRFSGYSTGGSAAITNTASGIVDFSNSQSDQTLGSLAGSGTVWLGYGVLNVGSLNTNTTFSGTLDDSRYGASGLSKVGTGTLTLDGDNYYYAGTTVSAGTLLVNGSSGLSLGYGGVTVQNGGTLGGTGLIGAGDIVIESGGHLAPGGSSTGTLTTNGYLFLYDGAVLDFRLGTASDRMNSGGTLYDLESSGGFTLHLTDGGGFGANTYILLDFANGYNNLDPENITIDTDITGYEFSLAINGTYLELTATLAAVPEPSTYAALAGLGALGLAVLRRRKF